MKANSICWRTSVLPHRTLVDGESKVIAHCKQRIVRFMSCSQTVIILISTHSLRIFKIQQILVLKCDCIPKLWSKFLKSFFKKNIILTNYLLLLLKIYIQLYRNIWSSPFSRVVRSRVICPDSDVLSVHKILLLKKYFQDDSTLCARWQCKWNEDEGEEEEHCLGKGTGYGWHRRKG